MDRWGLSSASHARPPHTAASLENRPNSFAFVDFMIEYLTYKSITWGAGMPATGSASSVIADRIEKGVLRLVLSNPGRKNAMTGTMRDALAVALSDAVADPDVRAIVLAGAGGDFSAGGDLQGLMAYAPGEIEDVLRLGQRVVETLWTAPKPTIAAVEGAAAGGAVALALACDHVIAAESSRFAFPFTSIGLVPDWGVSFFARVRAGPGAARRLLLAGSVVAAPQALALGLADEVVPDDRVSRAAIEAADRLAAKAPNAYARTKELLSDPALGVAETFAVERRLQRECFKSAEFLEGVDAFRERRTPDFTKVANDPPSRTPHSRTGDKG